MSISRRTFFASLAGLAVAPAVPVKPAPSAHMLEVAATMHRLNQQTARLEAFLRERRHAQLEQLRAANRRRAIWIEDLQADLDQFIAERRRALGPRIRT